MAALGEGFAVELAEGGNGRVVDVVDEARLDVEGRVIGLVDAAEVLRQERVVVLRLS